MTSSVNFENVRRVLAQIRKKYPILNAKIFLFLKYDIINIIYLLKIIILNIFKFLKIKLALFYSILQ